jgi:exodeoxyribonuclease VII large subunit
MAREQRLIASRLAVRMAQAMTAQLNPARLHVEYCSARMAEVNLRSAIFARRLGVASLVQRLQAAASAILKHKQGDLTLAASRLDVVSPLRVLERGYAMVFNQSGRSVIVDANEVSVNDNLEIRLRRGRLWARTTARET